MGDISKFSIRKNLVTASGLFNLTRTCFSNASWQRYLKQILWKSPN